MFYGYSYKEGSEYGKRYIMFETEDDAKSWLNTEEYDFRIREYGDRDWALNEWGEDTVCSLEDSETVGEYVYF